jgi:predicted HNH restriction endonuclease
MTSLRNLLELGEKFGVELVLARTGRTADGFTLRFREFPRPFGLEIQVRQNPLTWQSAVKLDRQAGEVLKAVRARHIDYPEEIQDLINVASNFLSHIELRVNNLEISLLDTQEDWQSLELVSKSRKYDSEPFEALRDYLTVIVGTVLDIFTEKFAEDFIGEEEGGAEKQTYNRYERSAVNRARCIEAHGTKCSACGIDPGSQYGLDSSSLIHVHHLKPLSMMGGRAAVNPISDLVPLCPTCHNVAHKRNPPFTPVEIKEMLG